MSKTRADYWSELLVGAATFAHLTRINRWGFVTLNGENWMKPGSLERMRILVVEDNYLIAETVCDVLRHAGAVPVGPVGDAQAAIKIATNGRLDGVLLDVKLRAGNGLTVADYLRSKNVPFVVMTAYDKETLLPRLRGAPYVAKPVHPSDLVKAAVAAFGPADRRIFMTASALPTGHSKPFTARLPVLPPGNETLTAATVPTMP